MKRIKISTFPVNRENPFPLKSMQVRQKDVLAPGVRVVEMETGEVKQLGEVVGKKNILHDGASYIKLFPMGVELIDGISKRTLSLLIYILRHMKPNQYEVEVRYVEAIKWRKALTGDAFYMAIGELLGAGFLARSARRGYYFINPNMFYNGDRRRIKQTKSNGEQVAGGSKPEAEVGL